jgi:LPS sulfotransferase NodH
MWPERSYFICTTPRSGSTLLAEALLLTGAAGRPREYFQELPSTMQPATPRDYVGLVPDPVVREVLTAPGVDEHAAGSEWTRRFANWPAYLEWVVAEATTSSGVFAAKVMWRYFGGLLLRLRATFDAADDLALLERAFGPPRFVFLRRADKLGQAISLWRAIQTWSWRADDGRSGGVQPVYSFAAIDHLVRRLELDEADWERWFGTVRVRPLELEYEALAADYGAVTRTVLEYLGIDGLVDVSAAPPLRRQAGETSQTWAERFRAEQAQSRELV